MNKKDTYFGILGKCLTVIIRLLWGMLVCSNRHCVIVVSLVSLTWQLLYKVSALQSRKRGCFWTQRRARAAASYWGGIPLLSCIWSSGAVGFLKCLILHWVMSLGWFLTFRQTVVLKAPCLTRALKWELLCDRQWVLGGICSLWWKITLNSWWWLQWASYLKVLTLFSLSMEVCI